MLMHGHTGLWRYRHSNAPLQNINIALSGSGSHAAFSWGILDKLLEDGRFTIEGVAASGASAMNAAVLAYGGMKGDLDPIRENLERLWREISKLGLWGCNSTSGRSDGYRSPYVSSATEVLESFIDFGELRRCRSTSLYLQATNAVTGHARIFTSRQITAEAILASSCLPQMSPPVSVDGEYYWDGSYSGLSALKPLIAGSTSTELLIGQISAVGGRKLPHTLDEMQARAAEIASIGALERDICRILADTPQAQRDWFQSDRSGDHSDLRVHRIESRHVMSDLTPASRLDVRWPLLTRLRDMGRLATEIWLRTGFDNMAAVPEVHPC